MSEQLNISSELISHVCKWENQKEPSTSLWWCMECILLQYHLGTLTDHQIALLQS